MKIITFEDLKPLKGIAYGRMQLWRREKAGTFPKRIRLSEQRFGWAEHEIDAWIAERIAERDATSPEAA